MTTRPRAADDFDAIRLRVDELRQEKTPSPVEYDFRYAVVSGGVVLIRPLSERALRSSIASARNGDGVIRTTGTRGSLIVWLASKSFTGQEVHPDRL